MRSGRVSRSVRFAGPFSFVLLFMLTCLLSACGGGGGKSSDVDVDVKTFVLRPTSGPLAGGTTVTIEGAGFTNVGDSSVLFGTLTATVIEVASGEQMLVRIPGAPGGVESVVDVVIQNSLIEVTVPQAFFYVGAPEIFQVTPGSVSVAGGDTIRVSGRNFTETADTVMTIDGQPVGDLSVTDSATLSATAPVAASLGKGLIALQNRNGSTSGEIRYRAPLAMSASRRHEGTESGAGFASALGLVGDLDADGFHEYAVGVPGSTIGGSSGSGPAGAIQVYAGFNDEPVLRVDGNGAANEAALGSSLVGIDWAQDGVRDIVVGAPASQLGVGEVHLYDSTGARVTTLLPGAGLTAFGRSLAVGDLDGDLVDDLIVGSNGAITVYSGTGSGVFLSVPNPDATLGNFGKPIVVSNDLSGDGVLDLLVGAPGDGKSTFGGIFVISGADGAVLHQIGGPGFGTEGLVAALDDVDGDGVSDYAYTSLGRILINSGQDHTSFRQVVPSSGTATRYQSLISVPDVDGDGLADLVAGITIIGSLNGAVLMVSGVGRSESWRIEGGPGQDQAGDRLGAAIAGGDIDADGLSEILVGAPLTDGGAGNDLGRVETWAQDELVVTGTIASGNRFDFHVLGRSQAQKPFQILVSTQSAPGIPVAGRTIPVGFPDPFVGFSFTFPPFSGLLDVEGYARSTIEVPPGSIPSGATFYGASFTLDASFPGGVGIISRQVVLTFE